MSEKKSNKQVIYDTLKHILTNSSSENGEWKLTYEEGPVLNWRNYRIIHSDSMMEYYKDSHFFTIKGMEIKQDKSKTTETMVGIKIPLIEPANAKKLMSDTKSFFALAEKLGVCYIPKLLVGTSSYLVTSWCGGPVHTARNRDKNSVVNYLEGLAAMSRVISVSEHFGKTPLKVLNVLWSKASNSITVDVGFDENMDSANGQTLAGILYAFIYGCQIRRTTDQFEYLVDAQIGKFMDDLLHKKMNMLQIKHCIETLTAIYGTSIEQVREATVKQFTALKLETVPNSAFFALDHSMMLTRVYKEVEGEDDKVAQTVSTVCENMQNFAIPGHFYMTLRTYLDRFCFHDKVLEIISALKRKYQCTGVSTLNLDAYLINQEFPDDDREDIQVYLVYENPNKKIDLNLLTTVLINRYNYDELFKSDSTKLTLIPNKSI